MKKKSQLKPIIKVLTRANSDYFYLKVQSSVPKSRSTTTLTKMLLLISSVHYPINTIVTINMILPQGQKPPNVHLCAVKNSLSLLLVDQPANIIVMHCYGSNNHIFLLTGIR